MTIPDRPARPPALPVTSPREEAHWARLRAQYERERRAQLVFLGVVLVTSVAYLALATIFMGHR